MGVWRVAVVGTVVLLSALALVPSPAAAYVRWDEAGPYLWGNLTWINGAGAIVWGPNPNTVDDQPPGQGGANTDGSLQRVGDPVAPAIPGPDTFVAAPLPYPVILNVSKPIQLVLNLKDHPENAEPCTSQTAEGYAVSQVEPSLKVQLLDGTKSVGGGYQDVDSQIRWTVVYPTRTVPAEPAGYGTCRFAMHPEATMLAQGTVLTLRIDHVLQWYQYPIGLQGDHRSTIRLPLLDPTEVVLRYPDLLPDPSEDDQGGGTTDGSGAGLFLASASFALAAGRKRSIAPLLCVLLVAVAASGCLSDGAGSRGSGDSSDALGGAANQTLVRDDGGLLTKAGTGTILGRVFDDMQIPIGGVHVGLLGLSNFTTSDSKGVFKFVGLGAGTYKVRFDKEEYKSFELPVEVKESFITRPDVTLFLINPKARDFRLHPHDYYLGAASKKVHDGSVRETCVPGPPDSCTFPTTNVIAIGGSDQEVLSIYPGTREVEVTLTWTEGARHPHEYGLQVLTNYEASRYNWSHFAPRASGQPFRIQTSWEMADPGHQPVSTWWFNLIPVHPTQTYSDLLSDFYVDPHYGDVTVKVVVYRGASMPLGKAHKDWWGTATKVPLLTEYAVNYRASTGPPGTPGGFCAALGGAVSAESCFTRYHMPAFPAAGKIIPPGAKFVDLHLKQSRETSPHVDWELYYKPANLQDRTASITTGAGAKLAPTPTVDGTTTKWRIPLKDLEPDPEYASRSTWWFSVFAKDEMAKWQDYQANVEFVSVGGSPLPSMIITYDAWASTV